MPFALSLDARMNSITHDYCVSLNNAAYLKAVSNSPEEYPYGETGRNKKLKLKMENENENKSESRCMKRISGAESVRMCARRVADRTMKPEKS